MTVLPNSAPDSFTPVNLRSWRVWLQTPAELVGAVAVVVPVAGGFDEVTGVEIVVVTGVLLYVGVVVVEDAVPGRHWL
jgi:hypothetical protein